MKNLTKSFALLPLPMQELELAICLMRAERKLRLAYHMQKP